MACILRGTNCLSDCGILNYLSCKKEIVFKATLSDYLLTPVVVPFPLSNGTIINGSVIEGFDITSSANGIVSSNFSNTSDLTFVSQVPDFSITEPISNDIAYNSNQPNENFTFKRSGTYRVTIYGNVSSFANLTGGIGPLFITELSLTLNYYKNSTPIGSKTFIYPGSSTIPINVAGNFEDSLKIKVTVNDVFSFTYSYILISPNMGNFVGTVNLRSNIVKFQPLC